MRPLTPVPSSILPTGFLAISKANTHDYVQHHKLYLPTHLLLILPRQRFLTTDDHDDPFYATGTRFCMTRCTNLRLSLRRGRLHDTPGGEEKKHADYVWEFWRRAVLPNGNTERWQDLHDRCDVMMDGQPFPHFGSMFVPIHEPFLSLLCHKLCKCFFSYEQVLSYHKCDALKLSNHEAHDSSLRKCHEVPLFCVV